MADRGRHDEQQAGGGGERGRQGPGGHEADDPGRQSRDLGVGEDHDVAIHVELVGPLGGRVGHHPLSRGTALLREDGLGVPVEGAEGRALAVLHEAVAVLVDPGDEPGVLPGAEPLRQGLLPGVGSGLARDVARAVHGVDQVRAGEGGHGGRRRVEDRDEEQGPEGARPRGAHAGDRVEAHDHVGQARGADHQRERDAEHVHDRLGAVRVRREPELVVQAIQGVEQPGTPRGDLLAQRALEASPEPELGDRVAREHLRDEHSGHEEGHDQDRVLRDLGPRDALHAAEHRVGEHDRHADHDALLDAHLEEAAEDHAHAAHLAGDVGEGDEDRGEDGDLAREARLVSVPDEVGHGELAELAQVRREQDRQQHVPARPAHEVDGAVVPEEADQPRHAEERGGAHPVRGGRHPVGERRHAGPRDVELARGGRARADGDEDVEAERQPHDQEGPVLDGHWSASSSTPNRRSRRAAPRT